MTPKTQVQIDIEDMLDAISSQRLRWKLILLNDDHTPMGIVVMALVRALKCTPERALGLMLYAHENGKATIMIDRFDVVSGVESILSQVPLGTEILPADHDDRVDA